MTANRNAPSEYEIVAVIPLDCLGPRRPVRADEMMDVRAVFWRLAASGVRLPAEPGVNVVEGGRP